MEIFAILDLMFRKGTNMKFFCEYCGYRIDADKDPKCPNCGASYKKNETYKRLEKEREEEKAQITEQQKENVKFFDRISKISVISGIIIFIIAVAIMITIVLSFGRTFKKTSSNIGESTINHTIGDTTELLDELEENNSQKSQKVTVGINEYGNVGDYQVKVTGYETTTFWYKKAKEGYEFVTFHLMVENLTTSNIFHEDVNCIVDGVAQTNDFTSGYSTIPVYIESEFTVTGDATFEVPISATSYDIRYGDYITIHIEIFSKI